MVFMKLKSRLLMYKRLSIVAVVFLTYSCNESNSSAVENTSEKVENTMPLFTSLPKEETNVAYVNKIPNATPSMNYFSYPFIYHGGGVSLGDINNDGFVDIYFTTNFGHNKLYVNQGNLKFQEMSKSAGVEGAWGWSTGTSLFISIIDVPVLQPQAPSTPADLLIS